MFKKMWEKEECSLTAVGVQIDTVTMDIGSTPKIYKENYQMIQL